MTTRSELLSALTRRDFIKVTASTAVAAAAAASPLGIFAQGSDKIKVGVIGCGGRGLYDTTNCLQSAEGVELVAMGDLFQDRLDATLGKLREKFADKVKVTPETCFTGFDAYEKVLKTDCNFVILTQPPHFRPQAFKAAVEAGKHVFMEKPVAVDPVGVRSVIETAAKADEKNLTVVAGTQARRMNHRIELIKRIRDGQIGEIVGGQCVRIGDAMMDWGHKERTAGMSDVEWQVRRWLFFTWLSGDFIAEMHVHELDIVNWLMDSTPEKCILLGGREVRKDQNMYGDVFDHFSGQYEYPNGIVINYMGAQIDGSVSKTYERIKGTKGVAYTDWSGSKIEGAAPWKFEEKDNNPVIQQHADQIAAIRKGGKLNEAKRVAESTLTAIMGRMSAYTARELKWDWAMQASKLDLSPAKYELGPLPIPPAAVPGKTQLI